MTTFGAVVAQRPALPPHSAVLGPGAFVATWGDRPAEEICIGLRPLSHRETMTALSEAAKESHQGGRVGDAIAARFNEALMAWVVALGACDPNDARKPYWGGDEIVRAALLPETVRHLFDEIEAAHLMASPTRPEAGPEDIDVLVALLETPEALEAVPEAKARRVRRLLRYCLDELRSAPP